MFLHTYSYIVRTNCWINKRIEHARKSLENHCMIFLFFRNKSTFKRQVLKTAQLLGSTDTCQSQLYHRKRQKWAPELVKKKETVGKSLGKVHHNWSLLNRCWIQMSLCTIEMRFSLKVQHGVRDEGQMYRLYRSQMINSSCVLCVPGVPEKGSAYENTHTHTDVHKPHLLTNNMIHTSQSQSIYKVFGQTVWLLWTQTNNHDTLNTDNTTL